ncbi:MAG: acyl carrier protein [Clostridia bacterium]|nr:acyl carrier protein [Clostridia bacterium]
MLEKIISIIANRLRISDIDKDTNMLEIDADSLDIISIIMEVEQCFSVHFEDEEIVDIRTPKDIEEIVLKKFS